MAKREKIQTTGIVKDNTKFLYYIKDGKVFRVPKKQSGVRKKGSEMELDAKLQQDPDYIYFVDEDGDIARVPRAKGRPKSKTGIKALARSKPSRKSKPARKKTKRVKKKKKR